MKRENCVMISHQKRLQSSGGDRTTAPNFITLYTRMGPLILLYRYAHVNREILVWQHYETEGEREREQNYDRFVVFYLILNIKYLSLNQFFAFVLFDD